MLSITKALINSFHKPSKLLQRDFFELELLQHSKNTDNFVNSSLDRTKDILLKELEKYRLPIHFYDEFFVDKHKEDTLLVIDPLEGLSNFKKSLPFFASSLLYFKKVKESLELQILIISFPALQEVYYLEKGVGMWGERFSVNNNKKFRLRNSQFDRLSESMVISDNLNGLKKNPPITRNFGSFYYHLISFASGKTDIIYLVNLSAIQKMILDLIVGEVGAIQDQVGSQHIASNNSLVSAFRQAYF